MPWRRLYSFVKNNHSKLKKLSGWGAFAFAALGCCQIPSTFAAEAKPSLTPATVPVQRKHSRVALVVAGGDKSPRLSAQGGANDTDGDSSGADVPNAPSNMEESILLSRSPENIDVENSRLDAVGGGAKLDITLPDTVSNFADAVALDSINLSQALLGAYGFSRDIKMAEARKEQAVSQSNQARGLLLPTLTLRNARGREISSPGSVTDPVTGNAVVRNDHLRKDETLTLRQPLIDGPSLLDWQRRSLIVDSRQGSVVSTQGDTYVSTIQAYLNVATTRLLAELYREYEQQLGFLFDYVSKRAEAGASSQADMERVRARNLAAKSARIEQEAAHAAAVLEFVRMTNLVPRSIILPRREEASREMPKNFDSGIDLALETNPDIRMLKAELEAVDKEISAAKARYLPRVDLELSDSKVTNAGGPVGLQHDQRAMMVVTWSVLNGSVDYYNLTEKQQKRTESFWKLEDQQRRLRQTLSAQYATLDATKSRIVEGYKEWNSTYRAARSMSQRMLSGNQSLLDLLDALDRVQQARARLVNLHNIEIVSVAQISRLIGNFPSLDQLAEQATARIPSNRNDKK